MGNGGGWGIRFINGFYDLTHPLASPVAGAGAQPVMLTASPAGACNSQPAPATAAAAIPAIVEAAPGIVNSSTTK
jgi:hypothetical protein